jgi:hypothetical protein
MSIIYRRSDRVRVKLHDLELSIRPLSHHEKAIVRGYIMKGQLVEACVMCMAICLKDVKGLKTLSGEDYKLEIDDDKLTEACLDDLLNIEHSADLIISCYNFLDNVPTHITNDGKEIEGVSVIKEGSPRKKSKPRTSRSR